MTMPLTADAQAIVLACSSLALDEARTVKPLTAGEWHELALALRQSTLERPRDLLGRAGDELCDVLDVAPAMGERLDWLLSRGGQLALELERLASRGIWVLTRADEGYPALLKQRLRGQAPPVLFGAGSQDRLNASAIAVVGSRDVDEQGLAFADALGRRCVGQGLAVISGGARGVDLTAMQGAIEAGGVALGVTVDPLERLVRRRDFRVALSDGSLTLLTPFHPGARWHAGNAMRRNRLVYAMASAAVVVASSPERGGTRAGALENLKAGWVPLHVRDDGSAGSRELIDRGGRPLAVDAMDELELSQLLAPVTDSSSVDPSAAGVVADVPTSTPRAREDLFETVWPALEHYLVEPRSVDDVASHFDLAVTQARAWLKRAAHAELVRVRARPRRYVIEGPEQERLFTPTHRSA